MPVSDSTAKKKRQLADAPQWRRPTRQLDGTTGFTWRRYLSRCGHVRVSVRVAGLASDARQVFYAERKLAGVWKIVGRYRGRQAAMRAAAKDLRQLPPGGKNDR